MLTLIRSKQQDLTQQLHVLYLTVTFLRHNMSHDFKQFQTALHFQPLKQVGLSVNVQTQNDRTADALQSLA
jgi:hypothetical protein